MTPSTKASMKTIVRALPGAHFWIVLLGVWPALGTSTAMGQDPDSVWVAPASASEVKSPLSDQTAAAHAGKVIYEHMCVICHGEKGAGQGSASVTLEEKPADFLSIQVRDESDGAIYWKITHGKPPMSSYDGLLTEKQRWELVAYIRTLEREHKQ